MKHSKSTSRILLTGTLILSSYLSASPYLPATQPEAVNPGPPVKLVFITGSQTLAAGACATVAVQAQDSFGNASNVTAATTITPTMSPGGGNTFYSDACTTVAGAVTMVANTSGITLYFKDTTAGAPSLSIANSGTLTNPPAQPEVINAGV